MPAEAIQVAIRVRPLNSRELGDRVAVTVGGGEVCVQLSQSAEPRSFTFDYGYSMEATQQQVQQDLGQNLLANAIDGYNSCLFAYGQTGAGKSWSITGDRSQQESRGLLPRISEGLVDSLSTDANTKEFQILCTYLEIYQEKMRDLMVKQSPLLEVRKHPVQGVYVPGLTGVIVKSYEDIEAILDTGNSHRQVAATAMNATSSRSHAVFTMNITQVLQDGCSRGSQLHIVDLAGSERQKKTAAEGDRLKEGAMINQSLTVLGQVIFALAGQATSKKAQHVPFRDSKLTYLLSDSLSGNSRTVMIAAISPAADNMEETLTTLRFAQSVKKIKTTVSKNEVQSTNEDVIIQQLRRQVADLQAELKAPQTAALPTSDCLPLCISSDRSSRPDPVSNLPQQSLSLIAPDATHMDQGPDELVDYRAWLEQLKRQMRIPGDHRTKPVARKISDFGHEERGDEFDVFTQQYEELQETAAEANFLTAWMMEHDFMPRASGQNDWTATIEWAVKKEETSIKLVGELKAWLQLRDATSDEVHIMFSCRPKDLKEIVEKLDAEQAQAEKKLNENKPVRDTEASPRDGSSPTEREDAKSHRELVKRATSGLIADMGDSEDACIAADSAAASFGVQPGATLLKDLEEENRRLKAEVERLRKENLEFRAKMEDCNKCMEERYSVQKDFESPEASFAAAQQNDGFRRGSITASENADVSIVVSAEENEANFIEMPFTDRLRKNASSAARKKADTLTVITHEVQTKRGTSTSRNTSAAIGRSVTPGRNVPVPSAKKAATASPAGKAASKQSTLRVPSTTGVRPVSPAARTSPFSPKAKSEPSRKEFSANANSAAIDTE